MTPELQTKIETFLDINRQPIAEGWCTAQKANLLASIVLEHKMSLAVEVGIFGGRSLIPMALAMMQQGFGCAWGIDPWELEAAIEGENEPSNDEWWKNVNLENIYRGFAEHVLRLGITKECRWLRTRGENAARFFDDGSIHLFHLDGNHSELASCRDVELWHGKLAEHSFFVLDDADWKTQRKAVDLIQSKGFSIDQNHGGYIVFKR